jgi:hypothetical protein
MSASELARRCQLDASWLRKVLGSHPELAGPRTDYERYRINEAAEKKILELPEVRQRLRP